MRISDWISDVCSSDLIAAILWLWQAAVRRVVQAPALAVSAATGNLLPAIAGAFALLYQGFLILSVSVEANLYLNGRYWLPFYVARSEEHTSELQSLMRTSYAVFCLKKKK